MSLRQFCNEYPVLHVSLSLFVASLLHWLFAIDGVHGPVFVLATGLGFYFILRYGIRMLSPIAGGFLSGFMLQRLIIGHETLPQIFILSLTQTLVLITTLYLGYYLIAKFHLRNNKSLITVLGLFLPIAFFISLYGGFFNAFFYAAVHGDFSVFLSYFLLNTLGKFSSLGLMVPFLYMSHHDKSLQSIFRWRYRQLLFFGYVTVFSGFAYWIMQGALGFNYQRHLYLTLIFFIVGSFFLTYRWLLGQVLLLLLLFRIVIYPAGIAGLFDHMAEVSMFFLYVYITAFIAMLLKRYLAVRFDQNRKLKGTNAVLDRTLDYINRFLKLSKDILIDSKHYEVYAKETFDIVSSMVPSAKAVFGYFDVKGNLEMGYALKYPIKRIPLFYELHDSRLLRQDDFYFIHDIEHELTRRYKTAMEDEKIAFKSHARLYLVYRFEPERLFIIGIDFDTRARQIHDGDIKRLEKFTELLNKLFLKQNLTKQGLLLKDDIILSFVRTLDFYDHYTKGHSEEVAYLAKNLAMAFKLDEAALNKIYWGGLLHDIGKLGVDYNILNKPGRLNASEYEHIKTHVTHSYELLKVSDALKDIAEIVYDHHEWYDGSGYPKGASGKTISLGGRILAVADAVATMSDDRPYRSRLNDQVIIKELNRYSGSQFDPQVTTRMIRLIENGILDRLKKA